MISRKKNKRVIEVAIRTRPLTRLPFRIQT